MIQTKTPVLLGYRDEKEAIIKVEVRIDDDTQLGGNVYLVIDWNLNDIKDALGSKKVFRSNEEIQQINEYLESNYDFSGMTKKDIEYLKVVIALMLDTKTNLLPSGKTICRTTADNWEYSPEILERFPILIPEI
jgi:hypothetical protein